MTTPAQIKKQLKERRINSYYNRITSGDIDPRIPHSHYIKFEDMIEKQSSALDRKAKIWAGKLSKMDDEKHSQYRHQVKDSMQERESNISPEEQERYETRLQEISQKTRDERVIVRNTVEGMSRRMSRDV